MGWTTDQMMELGSCYELAQFEALWDTADELTTVEFLELDAPVDDRAYIVTLMKDDDTLRLWACDMAEAFVGEWVPAVAAEDKEAVIEDVRAAVSAGKGEGWYLEEWRKRRGMPAGLRGLFHWSGAVAARLAYRDTRVTDPDNAEAQVGLLVTRLQA